MRKFLLIGFLLVLSVNPLFSQTEKGKVLVVVTTSIGSGSLSQVGFQSEKRKGDDFESDPTKTFNLNLAPKVGFFFWDNLALGIEGSVNYVNVKNDNFFGDDITGTYLLGGPLVRYYYGQKRARPFAEISALFGGSKFTFEDPDGIDPESIIKTNISRFNGGIGLATQLGNKVSFDTVLGYSYVIEKDPDDNPDNERTITSGLTLEVGISIYLN